MLKNDSYCLVETEMINTFLWNHQLILVNVALHQHTNTDVQEETHTAPSQHQSIKLR